MGLLDDAIREHLDLKRRRGADPTEIERAERDALGPVRRNRGEDAGEMEADAPLYAAAGSAQDEPDEGIASDLVDETGGEPAFDDDLGAERVMYEDPPTAEEEIVVRRDEPADADRFDEDPFEQDPFEDDEDAPATRVMRAADIPEPADRTAQFDVEEAFAQEDEPQRHAEAGDDEDEDVLEETPEFLQDTPDHDRLWFEQRPPRDFDFDN